MIQTCSPTTIFIAWIVIGVASVVFAVLTIVLESNLVYLVRRIISSLRRLGGRLPTRKPPIIWWLYILSILIVIIGTAVVSTCEPQTPTPPASEKLYYMMVIDASERMLASIGGTQKWRAAVNSLQEKLTILPSGAHYGLISFGQKGSSISLPCNEAAEVLVPVHDMSGKEESQAGFSQQRSLTAISNISPGDKGSLTQALHLALEQLVSGPPENSSKSIIIVTGGGDICNPQAEWDSLEFLLSSPVKDVGVYTELIVFVNEEVKEEIAAKVQKISRLEAVTVSLPTTAEELNENLEAAVDRAIQRGMTIDPTPFIIQETIVAATHNSLSLSENLPVSTNIPAGTPNQVIPTFTQLLPTKTSFVTLTNTLAPSPTNTPTNIPPTQIPPTPIPHTEIPPTSTSVPQIQWDFTSLDGNYGVLKIYFSAKDAHYQVFKASTNKLIFQTEAKYSTENDVKAGIFSSDSTKFAAAYHYEETIRYTWVRVWDTETGSVLYDTEIDGWITDLSGFFQ